MKAQTQVRWIAGVEYHKKKAGCANGLAFPEVLEKDDEAFSAVITEGARMTESYVGVVMWRWDLKLDLSLRCFSVHER